MKKVVLVLTCLFMALSLVHNPIVVNAENTEENITLYAKAAVLMDAQTGRVLYEKDGYTHMPNASTTKIMTCILAVESGKLKEEAVASAYAASMPKVHLGMQSGERFLLEDLLYSLMLESHNDSAVVIAEHIGQTVEGFAAMMNEKAKEIGCQDTYFITPNGLDATDDNGVHGTTARDLSLIMSYCMKNETFLDITRTASYSFSNIEGTRQYSCNNHNAFLSMMEGALTGKTGFTGNAGYCYVGALKQGDRAFVVALLACGWPNNKSYKWADTRKLMEYALDNYQYQDITIPPKELDSIIVEEAMPDGWELYQQIFIKPQVPEITLRILKKESEEIRTTYKVADTLKAPVEDKKNLGEISCYLGEYCIGSYPIVADRGVEKIQKSWYFQYILQEFYMAG